MSGKGGLIASVATGGVGERAGLQVGDRLLAINGHPTRDIVDVQFYGSEEELVLSIERQGAMLTLQGWRDYGEPWGVDFAEPLFDGIRTCANRCPFCFLAGLPPGLRPSLYIRDDDYRLSFLNGSFVTLSNLDEGDWARLAEQRLSPLYVSVQATEPDLRRRLLGGAPIPDIREQIRRLAEIGIDVHAQVVICPGLNDGRVLEQTVGDLWALRETVLSVALVPVGRTRHHPARLRAVDHGSAGVILAFARAWRQRAYRELGRRFVYPSDEIYLLAGQPVPGAATYDGFPQLANGVGLLRRFLDDWSRTKRRLSRQQVSALDVGSATLVSGQALFPYLAMVARGLSQALDICAEAVGVVNRFFGAEATVAGLLTAQDVVEQLAGHGVGDLVIVPRSMFDAAGERTLDDWSPERLARALGRPLVMASLPGDIVEALLHHQSPDQPPLSFNLTV